MMPSLMQETPLLYANTQSGYAYKVALLLGLLGLHYELRLVDLSQPANERSPEFQAVARFGEVPVLQVDGLVLCQSNTICEYLARRQSALNEGDESQRQIVREWLAWESERIGLNLAHVCAARFYQCHPQAVLTWYDERAAQDIARLDKALSSRAYLLGEHPTIADIACYAWLPYAQSLGLFTALPAAVAAWQARIESLPGYAAPSQVFFEESV